MYLLPLPGIILSFFPAVVSFSAVGVSSHFGTITIIYVEQKSICDEYFRPRHLRRGDQRRRI
jgi:hypothetical protein